MNDLQKQFLKEFPKGLIDEPLKNYATFKIGGSADFFYKCEDVDELPRIVKFAKENQLPFYLIGAASNILFSDQGFRGLIIRIDAENVEIEGEKLIADAGAMASKLVNLSIDSGLTGLENWLGLPGTVGGAVRGNAGCNGLETKDILESAVVFDPESGDISEKNCDYFEFEYRHSRLKESSEIVLKTTFKLKKLDISKDEQEELIQKYRGVRMYKQPFGATTGSFFKNPSAENPAGMLIDKAGLKGKKLGKAQISDKHANFFINTGDASSEEILELARLAKREVEAKFSIELEPEVIILGENGPIKLD